MSTLDSFLSEVRPWAPGVPDQVAYKNIRLAAIEFCERTRLWKYEDTYDISEADCDGGIYAPNGSAVHDIELILFDGRELTPISTRDLDIKCPGWRTGDTLTGSPCYFTQFEPGTLRIVPASAGSLYLCLRLKPSQDTMELPDMFGDEYRECLGWGALGRILTVPGQSYSNPELASFYMGRFSERLDRLANKGFKGQQNAPMRTRSRYF